jgi:hypothetical protein
VVLLPQDVRLTVLQIVLQTGKKAVITKRPRDPHSKYGVRQCLFSDGRIEVMDDGVLWGSMTPPLLAARARKKVAIKTRSFATRQLKSSTSRVKSAEFVDSDSDCSLSSATSSSPPPISLLNQEPLSGPDEELQSRKRKKRSDPADSPPSKVMKLDVKGKQKGKPAAGKYVFVLPFRVTDYDQVELVQNQGHT